MFKINRILSLIAAFALIVVAANAQEKPPATSINTNYETILQLVAASNDSTQKSSLPPNLENISRQIKNDFGYSNYRVVLSSLNRSSNNNYISTSSGIVSYNLSGFPASYNAKYFIKRQIPNEAKQNARNNDVGFEITDFEMDLRIPYSTKVESKDDSKANIIYERLNVSSKLVILTENEPTIIGTLTSSRADELLILVMTVREAKADARNLAKKR